MGAADQPIGLTTAQAIIRFLAVQFIEIDDRKLRFCSGGLGTFGHGIATCLGEALCQHREELPLYCGRNEQGMGFAAAAYTKAWLRQRFMFATASAGPGRVNLLAAVAAMLDPDDCGPAFLGLPQDVQGWAYDCPADFFAPMVYRIQHQAPDEGEIADAVALLRTARRPLKIVGGGVQYCSAGAALPAIAEAHRNPVVATNAGRANQLADHPLNIGPVGVTGSDGANAVAGKVAVFVAAGTRLQGFATGSCTAVAKGARIISVNDAGKHRAPPVVGNARRPLAGHKAPSGWTKSARSARRDWGACVAGNVSSGDQPNSYAQAIGVVNARCHKRDRIIAATGGLPAGIAANWRTRDPGTVDIEFGFSSIGCEISGRRRARIAPSALEPARDTIVFNGGGSDLLVNSDIHSSVLTQKRPIVRVLDNGGFAVIDKLQAMTGNESCNNLIADRPTVPEPFAVDFAAHARAMGAVSETVANAAELAEAFMRAKAADRTTVIVIKVDAHEDWTTGGQACWEVETPQVSPSGAVRMAHKRVEAGRDRQGRCI